MSKSMLVPDMTEEGVVTLYASPIRPITVFPQFFPQGTKEVKLILTNRPDSLERSREEAQMRQRWNEVSGWYEKLYAEPEAPPKRGFLFALRLRIARWLVKD